jgi:hypothetical protein
MLVSEKTVTAESSVVRAASPSIGSRRGEFGRAMRAERSQFQAESELFLRESLVLQKGRQDRARTNPIEADPGAAIAAEGRGREQEFRRTQSAGFGRRIEGADEAFGLVCAG